MKIISEVSSIEISSPDLEFRFFGTFEIYVRNHRLKETDIKGRKARSLLKLIAHRRNHQIVRDQLADQLWPDLETEAANAQLYKALHHIRKAFARHEEEGADWIGISDDLIRINPPGGIVTDLKRFEQMARDGLRDQNISTLEKAISIYTGDFLPMDRYAEWASLPREHYRQLYLDLLTTMGQLCEQEGDLSGAAEILRVALEKEPTLETAHCGLMRIFARKGQPTRAFHQYDRCREVLREELGVSPSPVTMKVLDDIREGRLTEEVEKSTPPADVPGSTTPIIGRAEECDRIDRHLSALSAGTGGAMLICGETGIGKTRLARECMVKARRKGLPSYMARSGSHIAYGPFIELIEEVLRIQPDLEEFLPVELGNLLPGFSGEGKPAPHADKLAARGYLFARVHHFFSKLAEDNPMVVILEDLHEADRGSRELFTYLNRHRSGLSVLFVATLQKEEGTPEPELVQHLRETPAEIIELAPFTYEEHVTLLHLHAESAVISADAAGQIYQLSEGNPLYALELLRHYTDNDFDVTSPQHKQTGVEPSDPVSEKIPASIHYMVEQKLENLSPPARHLLFIAAILGRRVSYELLASIWKAGTNDSDEVLFNALEESIRARLLREHGLDYSFRHKLVQQTIYASISEARRRILHKQAADRLLEFSADTGEIPVHEIARHYEGAGELTRGARYLTEAGKQSEKVYAHDSALESYQEAYHLLESENSEESSALKCEILERTGDVYRACGRLEKSYDAYEEAITLTEQGTSVNQNLMELHRKIAVVAIFRTEIDRSEKHLEKAFELAGDDRRSLARLHITKALHLWHLNRLEEAYDVAFKAHNLAEQSGYSAEVSQACEILAMICLPLGRWEEGLKYEMERKVHGWSPEVVVATDAHLCLWEYHVSGDQPFQKAHRFMEQVAEQAEELGDLRCVAVCHYALGTMHLWRGERRQAVDELASSLKLHEQVGSPAGMAYALARKSVLHTLMGAKELGWQAVREGLTFAEQAAVRDHCLQRLYGVGIWNRLEAGDHTGAREMAEKSEQLLEKSGACGACALELYPWLAYYYLQNNEIDRVRECGKAVSELAEITGNPIGKAIAWMIESSLSVTDKDREKAAEYSRKSRKILEENVPEAEFSPVVHYMEKMAGQQENLQPAGGWSSE